MRPNRCGARNASVERVPAASDSGAISIVAGNHLASLGVSQLRPVFPGGALILFSFFLHDDRVKSASILPPHR